jgi:HK97 family phage major capsid protein
MPFTTGTGTAPNPQGILTKLDATAASEVLLTTAGAFGQEDVYKVWAQLPAKYHPGASWMMATGVNNKVRAFGATNMYHAYTVNLAAGAADVLMGKQVWDNPYMSDFNSTTAHQNVAIVGDWSNMVIARRRGLSVELVPHLFHTSSDYPSGQRGLFAYGRIGANVVNTAAFRLLNQT